MTVPAPEPGAVVTISKMFEEVRGLSATMGRVEERLDRVLEAIESLTADHHGMDERVRHLEEQRLPERVDDHEGRLRHLEERRMPHSVISIVAAAGATLALAWQAMGH